MNRAEGDGDMTSTVSLPASLVVHGVGSRKRIEKMGTRSYINIPCLVAIFPSVFAL